MSILLNALKIIFLLGFLIFIHEGGHFLAARFSKVKVEEFSIGFGPKILKIDLEKACLELDQQAKLNIHFHFFLLVDM